MTRYTIVHFIDGWLVWDRVENRAVHETRRSRNYCLALIRKLEERP